MPHLSVNLLWIDTTGFVLSSIGLVVALVMSLYFRIRGRMAGKLGGWVIIAALVIAVLGVLMRSFVHIGSILAGR